MSFSQIKNKYVSGKSFERYTQGSILANIVVYEINEVEIAETKLPYAVVLTQDCDLDWDFKVRQKTERNNEDKLLPSILLCPAYLAENVRTGSHLEAKEIRMQSLNSSLYRPIKQNNNPRYHFLSEDLDLQVPELIIDFKHYYTLSTEMVYSLNKDELHLVSISEVFREHLSQRFSQYLSRIGLPVMN